MNDAVRVIIAGGRDFGHRSGANGYADIGWCQECERRLAVVMESLFPSQTLVILCGEARGADTLGKTWAKRMGHKVLSFPAEWDKLGKAAGHVRNEHMAQQADVLVAFWDGESRGTEDMIRRGLSHGLEVHVYRYAPQKERF